MPQSDPFPILDSAGLEKAARSCPLLKGGTTEYTKEWIACCSRRFFRAARSIVGDDALAEDVLQESWIKIMQKIKSYASGPVACPWVHAVVSNTAKDVLRARRQKREDPMLDVVDPTQDLETPEEQQQMLRLLREMIAVLPETYRQVAQLRIYGELSVEETAESLGISQSNVSVRLHRAADMLKKRLDARLRPRRPLLPDPPAA